MDDKYNVIVLGTGFKECLLGGLLSTDKKKVLHLDKNGFYGGDGASLNLAQLFKKFRPSDDGSEEKIPPELGLSQKYAVDLCPKFVMASGSLIQILLHTGARQLLDFRSVQGCYVVKEGSLFKVPSSAKTALTTGLLDSKAKKRFKSFLTYIESYDQEKTKTHKGRDLSTLTAADLYKEFNLDETTIHFAGRCIALEPDDSYLTKPAIELVNHVKLYAYSTVRYGKSPFIYPLWGVGGLPEAFSRTCAINGGVFMLNKPIKEVVFGDDGRVTGVTDADDNTVSLEDEGIVVADPSYFADTDKVTKEGRVARAVCIIDHPIEGIEGDSCHIVIPATECERKSDIYMTCVSDKHNVCPSGKYIVVCSAKVEGDSETSSEEDLVKQELSPAFKILDEVLESFCCMTDLLVPSGENGTNGLYLTGSLDATADFGPATQEVLGLYEQITGAKLELSEKK